MDIAVIEKLIQLMNGTTLQSLEIEEKDMRIKLENMQAPAASTVVVTAPSSSSSDPAVQPAEEKGETINAPIVGIFHPKSLQVGDAVEVGTTVCVIEAMKLMNEIESEKAGEIAEILVNDGDAVEFGQPLFRLK